MDASSADYFSLSSDNITRTSVDKFIDTSGLTSSLADTFRTLTSTEEILRGIELGDSIVALTADTASIRQLYITWCNSGSPWQLDMAQLFSISKLDVEIVNGNSVFNGQQSPLDIKYRKTDNGHWNKILPVRYVPEIIFVAVTCFYCFVQFIILFLKALG